MANADVKLKDILAKVLLTDENEINDDMSRESIDEWDSMAHLMLMSEIESTFEVALSDDDIMRIHTVGDIKKILRNIGVTF